MKLNFALLLIISSCISQAAKAVDAPWYEIEIIVFEQSTQTRLESENWDQRISLPEVDKSRDFFSADPSLSPISQLCMQGSMVQVLEVVPVIEVVDKIEPQDDEQPLDIEPKPEEKPFVILEPDLNQLNELKKSLSRRRGYHPLLHISWRQPVENKRNSKLTRLYSGKNYSDTFNPEGDARVNIATAYFEDTDDLSTDDNYSQEFSPYDSEQDIVDPFTTNSSNILPFEDYRQSIKDNIKQCQQIFQQISDVRHHDVWQLDGNIRLYVERYLHIETNLYLRIPGKKELQLGAIETGLAADRLLNTLQTDPLQTDSGFGWQLGDDFLLDNQQQSTVIQDVLNKYALQQSRRLRSNEIHYIDHPLFGILLQIRPYDRDAEKDDEFEEL